MLGVGELRVELARIGHEGAWIHHAVGKSGRIVDLGEAVAIVVGDGGLVDPGAHDCRRVVVVSGEPIWLATPLRQKFSINNARNDWIACKK